MLVKIAILSHGLIHNTKVILSLLIIIHFHKKSKSGNQKLKKS